MSKLGGFQEYLVDRGWRRYIEEYNRHNKGFVQQDDYHTNFLSAYNPLTYLFSHPEYGTIWYGLSEKGKPPVMFLGEDRIEAIYVTDVQERTTEDLYRILFSGVMDYDDIYEHIVSNNKFLIVFDDDNKPSLIK